MLESKIKELEPKVEEAREELLKALKKSEYNTSEHLIYLFNEFIVPLAKLESLEEYQAEIEE